jgi:hypothetical protein
MLPNCCRWWQQRRRQQQCTAADRWKTLSLLLWLTLGPLQGVQHPPQQQVQAHRVLQQMQQLLVVLQGRRWRLVWLWRLGRVRSPLRVMVATGEGF